MPALAAPLSISALVAKALMQDNWRRINPTDPTGQPSQPQSTDMGLDPLERDWGDLKSTSKDTEQVKRIKEVLLHKMTND